MSEHIDHAAEAVRLIELSSVQHFADESRTVSAAAQVHATLALVEQQRIANLIALANAHHMGENYDDTVEASREAAYALIHYVQRDPDDEFPRIHPDIAAALGIGDDDE